jgi:hypothetical protein
MVNSILSAHHSYIKSEIGQYYCLGYYIGSGPVAQKMSGEIRNWQFVSSLRLCILDRLRRAAPQRCQQDENVDRSMGSLHFIP